MNQSINLSLSSTFIAIVLFCFSIIFYSTTPLVLGTLLFLPIFFIYFFNLNFNKISTLVLLFCIFSIPALSHFFSLTESLRFIFLVILFLFFYLIGTKNSTPDKYFKILTVIFFSCSFIVIYYHTSIFLNAENGLISGNRYYDAREYLFLGNKYEFKFGITHLNFYTSYCLLYSIIRATLLKQKEWYLLVFFFLFLSIISQSRGPVLFAVISFLSVWACLRVHKYKSYKSPLILFFSIAVLMVLYAPIFWLSLKNQGHTGDYRLLTAAATDISRLSYFLLGIEHLLAYPFGNVLIYSADSDLQNYHNTFLTIANRNGIISFVIIFFCIALSFIRSITLLKNKSPTFYTITPVLIYLYCLFFFNIEDVMRFDRFVYLLLAYQLGVSEQLYKYSVKE